MDGRRKTSKQASKHRYCKQTNLLLFYFLLLNVLIFEPKTRRIIMGRNDSFTSNSYLIAVS